MVVPAGGYIPGAAIRQQCVPQPVAVQISAVVVRPVVPAEPGTADDASPRRRGDIPGVVAAIPGVEGVVEVVVVDGVVERGIQVDAEAVVTDGVAGEVVVPRGSQVDAAGVVPGIVVGDVVVVRPPPR